jgi:hypothetical protein
MAALAVVGDGPTLDERLAEARQAEIAPRNKVAELTSALEAAIEAKDYAKAGKLQGQLVPAREALALAEVEARVLREQRQALDNQLAADRRGLEDQQRRDEAQRAIGEAQAADALAQAQIDACITRMYEHLAAARADLIEAQGWQQKASDEQRRVWQARMTAGEIDGMPRIIPPERKVSVLADSVPLVGVLVRWDGPPHRPGPVPAAAPASGRGAIQPSPW